MTYGIYSIKNNLRWRAGGTIDGKRFNSSKSFLNEIDAAIAYDDYILKNNINRELNFPKRIT